MNQVFFSLPNDLISVAFEDFTALCNVIALVIDAFQQHFCFLPHQGGFDNKVYSADVEFSTGAAPSATQVLAKPAISHKPVASDVSEYLSVHGDAPKKTVLKALHWWFISTAV